MSKPRFSYRILLFSCSQAAAIRLLLAAIALFLMVSAAPSQPAQLQHATVSINAAHTIGKLNPDLYGSFMELMAWDVKYGLYAEMLHDRSFEEPVDPLNLPREWNLEPDERNDNVGAIRFEQTTVEAHPATNAATGKPEHSLRVTVTSPDISDVRSGLSQGDLSVIRSAAYVGYVWIKVPQDASAFKGNITIALEEDVTGGRTYASAPLGSVTGDWRRYSFRLMSSATDRHAKLSILFQGTGTLFLDQASLMPADAVSGVRPDVMSRVRELHPAFVRWPGGNVAQDYHWQWGVGPRDRRPSWTNAAWSNAIEPSDFGTDEFLAFCQAIGAKPSITVNVEGAGATAEEAANWVEYVNGPVTSKFGALRAANGHPEPYHVALWELGNEVYGRWVRGHADAETYAQSALRYIRAMRAVDPTIRIIAVGESSMPDASSWDSTVLGILGSNVDYLAVHDYTTRTKNQNNRALMMAQPAEFERHYQAMHALIAGLSPAHPAPFIVNEWNLFYPSTVIQSMEGAVYAARLMNAFERNSSQISMNAVSDLIDGWVGGIIQSSRDRVYVTPQFHAIAMYAHHLGSDALETSVKSPSLEGAPAGQMIHAIDAVASRSEDGGQVFVKLSNASLSGPIEATIKLGGVRLVTSAELILLSAGTRGALNTFAKPDVVHPVTEPVKCASTCRVVLPPDSVAVLTLRLQSKQH